MEWIDLRFEYVVFNVVTVANILFNTLAD